MTSPLFGKKKLANAPVALANFFLPNTPSTPHPCLRASPISPPSALVALSRHPRAWTSHFLQCHPFMEVFSATSSKTIIHPLTTKHSPLLLHYTVLCLHSIDPCTQFTCMYVCSLNLCVCMLLLHQQNKPMRTRTFLILFSTQLQEQNLAPSRCLVKNY